MKRSLFVLVGLLLAVGCGSSSEEGVPEAAEPAESQSPPTTLASPTPEPVPAQLPDVVARVNGRDIARADLERAVAGLASQMGGPVPAEKRDEAYRAMIEQLVGHHLLIQECEARSLKGSEADVEAQVKQVRSQFPGDVEFGQALGSRGLTVETMKAEIRNSLAIAKLLELEVKPKLNVTDAAVSQFYEANPSEFTQGESVHASHILIRAAEGAAPEEKKVARERADGLLKQLGSGSDFAALAKEHSEDPGSGSRGGDLGFFPRGAMVAPFEEAAFALAAGETSDVVESPFGYHIIRVVERKDATVVPLDQVRDRIRGFLMQQQEAEILAAYVLQLKGKGKVEILI